VSDAVVSSAQNPRVRAVVALHDRRARRDAGLHLAEGRKVVGEAIACADVIELLHTAEHDDLARLLEGRARLTRIADHLAGRISDAVTGPGVVAIVRTPDQDADLPAAGHVLVLDRLADPGNVGTLVRTAAAMAFAAVVVVEPTVDPFGPKAVRASAGACYRIPVLRRTDLAVLAQELRRSGRVVAGLAAEGRAGLDALGGSPSVALVLGTESHGLDPGLGPGLDAGPDLTASGLDVVVAIPMPGAVESLNVAAAGAIAMHAVIADGAPASA
jgi:TrmH family RNA methyltransferase